MKHKIVYGMLALSIVGLLLTGCASWRQSSGLGGDKRVSENGMLKAVYYRDTTATTKDPDKMLPDGYGFYVVYSVIDGEIVPDSERQRPFIRGVCDTNINNFEFPSDGSILIEYSWQDSFGGILNKGVKEVYCPIAK